jgi:hypothetical protein
MKVEEGKYSIAELVDWFKTRDLIVNKDYQRGGGLWPQPAKSYFIDTILKEYPFPKIYFHERIDKESKRPRREIVDGQQRIITIVDFAEGRFALGGNAVGFEGRRFADLSEDEQDSFYAYTVSVDVIRNASRPEILQMFRRMNAYTLPLNEAEKRHSEFFGEFKNWVNTVLDSYGSIFSEWGVFSSRQAVRMADAEFVADVALILEEGIVSTSPGKLRALYKKYDETFPSEQQFNSYITGAIEALATSLSAVQDTYITRPHVLHSLLAAMMHNRFNLPNIGNTLGLQSTGHFFANAERAVASLRRLALAHEQRDIEDFPEYVQSASEGGNRAAQREVRVRWLYRALQGEFA